MSAAIDPMIGFPPVCTGSDLVLILGSFPGRSSLEKKEYYGHRNNGFWPIMGQLLGFDPQISYLERLERLKINRIALWDVLTSCSRDGSLDSSIERNSMTLNNFEDFFENNKFIHTILFNGSMAEAEFSKQVLKNSRIQAKKLAFQRLPSTSPAMAMLNLAQKVEAWS
ncbi:MAG: DNA-deoxyinosine glycosylase, partial [Desulfocapsaceae bacterium]